MKILFDARYMPVKHLDGIGRYSAELGGALSKLVELEFLIFDKAQLKYLPEGCKYHVIHSTTSPMEPFTALVLNRLKPDVVFSPMQTMGSYGRKYKLILSLHDMIYYHYKTPPTWLSWWIRMGWWLYHQTYVPGRIFLNRADIAVTVSEASKKELLETKLTKRPIIVVPNAPNDLRKFLSRDVDISQPPENLVYMGSFMPYKNTEALVRAMKHLPNHKLHLLSFVTDARQAELEKLAGGAKDRVIFHGGVSDKEYAEILSDRALLVTASFIEGFGIPIAEAATLGVPSVIADTPIFHEVGGDSALYFTADDENDFVDKINKASDVETYKKLSHAAKISVKRFSWDESAKILLEAIKSLV